MKSIAALHRLIFLGVIILITLSLISVIPLDGNILTARANPEASNRYVAPTGTDSGNCTSSASPCKTIQYAVNKSATGDTILVAGGSYTYQSSTDTCTFLVTRAVVCVVNKHLSILGGYSTSNWTTPNPVANLTVIDGNNANRGVALIASNATANLRMEGFTIQNGLAQGNTTGGDFYIDAAGGGMWSQGGALTLRQMIFKNNRAVGGNTTSQYGGSASGGGLAIHSPVNNLSSLLEYVTFEGNQALGGSGVRRGGIGYGGGMYAYSAIVSGNHLTFTNNLAQAGDSAGSGVDGVYGLRADALGGAAGFGKSCNVTLTQVTATGNVVLGGDAGNVSGSVGGGAFGGAFHAEDRAVLTLQDALVHGNTVTGGKASNGGFAMGGGIMTDGGAVHLNRVRVVANTATSGAAYTSNGKAGQPGGGGVYLASFNPSINIHSSVINTVIAGNSIVLGAPGGLVGGGGAGMTVQAITADIKHSTVANNNTDDKLVVGQAISVQAMYAESGTPAVVNIENSIIANHIHPSTSNTSAVTVMRTNTVNFNKGLFSGNTNNTNSNSQPFPPGAITGLSTMIQVSDPRFVSPGSPNFNYHLTNSSPAIDKAVSSSINNDMDGDTRPYFTSSDIGADEYTNPFLRAQPDAFFYLVDSDDIITETVAIVVYGSSPVNWNATTSGSWLFLGSKGNTQQTSGQTGTSLSVWVKPSNVGLSAYTQTIQITAPGVDPATVTVRLIKVSKIHAILLPIVLR